MEDYINEDNIINDDIYKKLKDSITCPLCINIFINPLICLKCQNVYCKKCIDDWNTRDNKCPNRCTEKKKKKSILANQLLSSLNFKCPICGKTIGYDDMQKHHDICSPEKINEGKIIWDYIGSTENNNTPIYLNAPISLDTAKYLDTPKSLDTPTTPNFEKISREEMEKYRQEGIEVTYMTSKNIFYYNYFILF